MVRFVKLDRIRNVETPFRWARAILFWKMGSCITRAVKELADKLFTISVIVFNWKSWTAVFLSCLSIENTALYSRLGESD